MNKSLLVIAAGFCVATIAQAGQPIPTPRSCERQLCNDLRNCSVGKRTVRDLRQQHQQGTKAETSQNVANQSCRDEALENYLNCAIPSLKHSPSEGTGTQTTTKSKTPVAKTTK
jgi:hypothetical protein